VLIDPSSPRQYSPAAQVVQTRHSGETISMPTLDRSSGLAWTPSGEPGARYGRQIIDHLQGSPSAPGSGTGSQEAPAQAMSSPTSQRG
jgi:hypothetical protein